MLLPRPFKITKIGPVGLFVADVARAEAFYVEHLGFVKSEETVYRGARCVFLRAGAEHHSVGLFPRELRRTLGLSEHTTCMSFGVEVGQLRAAARGRRLPEIPRGDVRRLDPAGALSRASITRRSRWTRTATASSSTTTWSRSAGTARCGPPRERRAVPAVWPETLEPLSDTYVDQVYQGPLG